MGRKEEKGEEGKSREQRKLLRRKRKEDRAGKAPAPHELMSMVEQEEDYGRGISPWMRFTYRNVQSASERMD